MPIPVDVVAEAFDDPQIRFRKTIIEIPHPTAGKVPIVASPMRFKETPLKHEIPPPLLGEHTAEILNSLGVNDAEIEQLKKDGVI